jgi:hypothetical protein
MWSISSKIRKPIIRIGMAGIEIIHIKEYAVRGDFQRSLSSGGSRSILTATLRILLKKAYDKNIPIIYMRISINIILSFKL